ncbi:hypothetical protein SFMTTN_3286 [Sulfuriferula multivorans]|uniref:Uncharacterized protein n=1 Tax=Sulfuriferula multivorans TaxID=1559896 RepID=A0A401JHH3_9PROT|nr:hypothetical protein SFMTTN_3286 [Sulfuriferula multivorans]
MPKVASNARDQRIVKAWRSVRLAHGNTPTSINSPIKTTTTAPPRRNTRSISRFHQAKIQLCPERRVIAAYLLMKWRA